MVSLIYMQLTYMNTHEYNVYLIDITNITHWGVGAQEIANYIDFCDELNKFTFVINVAIGSN